MVNEDVARNCKTSRNTFERLEKNGTSDAIMGNLIGYSTEHQLWCGYTAAGGGCSHVTDVRVGAYGRHHLGARTGE